MRTWFVGHYDIANAITLFGLCAGLVGGFAAWRGAGAFAASALLLAGLCDLFDGFVARTRSHTRTKEAQQFGRHLDTIVDSVSFCVVPVLISYPHVGTSVFAYLVCLGYIACGVIRLAHFETHTGTQGSVRHYTGLPVTYGALIVPAALLFRSRVVLLSALCVTSLLFILTLRIPKPRGVFYVVFPVIAVVLGVLGWLL